MQRRHHTTHLYYHLLLLSAAGVIICTLILYKVRESSNNDIMMMQTTTTDYARVERKHTLDKRCSAAVDKLSSLNINFLAIDFDQTMIDTHTGGRWKDSVAELAQHMRPVFLALVPMAHQRNMRIAICTFSGQTQHIREVLETSYPKDISESIIIRGNDNTWTYVGNGMKMGKQEHVASAAEELMAKPKLGVTDITKSTTLLIDDDPRNIKKSLKDGTRAVWFNPKEADRLLDDILLLK